MKIKIRVHIHNYNLIERRKEMGYTQAEFAKQSTVPMNRYCAIEKLENPYPVERPWLKRKAVIMTRDCLNKIAAFADCTFDYLFPPDYIEALEQELLAEPWTRIEWAIEVKVNELPQRDMKLLVDNTDLSEGVEYEELKGSIHDTLEALPPREQRIIKLRYGIDTGETKTLEEAAKAMGVTRERIRQLECQGLSRMRSSQYRRKMRPYLKESE